MAYPGEAFTPTSFEKNHPILNALKPWGSKRRKVAALRKHLHPEQHVTLGSRGQSRRERYQAMCAAMGPLHVEVLPAVGHGGSEHEISETAESMPTHVAAKAVGKKLKEALPPSGGETNYDKMSSWRRGQKPMKSKAPPSISPTARRRATAAGIGDELTYQAAPGLRVLQGVSEVAKRAAKATQQSSRGGGTTPTGATTTGRTTQTRQPHEPLLNTAKKGPGGETTKGGGYTSGRMTKARRGSMPLVNTQMSHLSRRERYGIAMGFITDQVGAPLRVGVGIAKKMLKKPKGARFGSSCGSRRDRYMLLSASMGPGAPAPGIPKPAKVPRSKRHGTTQISQPAPQQHAMVHKNLSAYHAQQASHFATQSKREPGQGHEAMAQAHASMAAQHKVAMTKPPDPTSAASHTEQSQKHASEAARHMALAKSDPDNAATHEQHAKAYQHLSEAHARIAATKQE